ncbi:putative multidrug export ATP-binding/permease protein [Phycisphaerae bacterium RAS1]|nr:putative multidrug export ATP-binding/permease protein [Phycisphaerae bacterium RAS1]
MTPSRRRYREFLAERYRQTDLNAPPDSARRGGPADAPRPDGKKPPSPLRKTYFREYLAWLRPFRGAIVAVFLLALVTGVLSLVTPTATMYIVDHILPSRDWAMLHLLGGSIFAMILVQQSLDLLKNWQTAKLNARVLFRLRQKLFNHLLRLPLHEISDMKTGGVTSRLSGDVDSLSGLVQMAIITPGVAGLKVALTIAALFWVNWRMAVGAILFLPPIVLLNLTYIKRIRPIYGSMRRDRSDIDARVVETFGGIRVVRAFRREAAEAKQYGFAHHVVIRKTLLARAYEYVVWAGWGFVIPLSALLIVWFGGALVLQGKATIGGIFAFQMYLLMLMNPVSNIVQSYGETQQALAAMERVFEILRRPADKPDRPGAISLECRGGRAHHSPATVESSVGTFEFERVTFGYRGDAPVLHDISLSVRGGMTVALVGPSGAGKTTVTNLVARFYDPDSGSIRLNGVDLRDIRLASYRRLLGLVQQDVFLFDGTIAENIAYARPSATPAQIADAARRANADGFIGAFAQRYETIIGERGVRLSGGQAQRISIARAILADPQILILDEATSNLDSESEQLIQQSMRELLAGRTTFVIAHRLSTVVSAHLIVVLDAGRVVETGTHDELLAGDSRYRAMVERQQRGMAAAREAQEADWLA